VTEVHFYHLTRTPLEHALPRLLEKALGAGYRVVVKAAPEAELERLNRLLWTYDPASFLPHGSAKDGWEREQPIFLTSGEDCPNAADLGCQVAGAEFARVEAFKRVLDLFDGRDDEALASARERWQRYKAAGFVLAYHQQKPNGGWERKV
jgi:DNA polymerase-3 subunit chi